MCMDNMNLTHNLTSLHPPVTCLRGRVLVNKWAQVIVPDVAAGKSIVHVINKVCVTLSTCVQLST